MKHLLYVISTTLLLCSCNNDLTVSPGTLTKEGSTYKYNNELFTGSVIDSTKTGQVLISFNCVDGKIIGDYVEYHNNGNISVKCAYIDGEIDGLFTEYDESGNTFKEINFLNGQKTGVYKEYFASGKLNHEGKYKAGKKEGEWIEYYENNSIRAKGNYSDDLQNDAWTYYFKNGKKNAEGNYINGDGKMTGSTRFPMNGRDGIWRYYTQDSEILDYEKKYVNSEAVSLKAYNTNGTLSTEAMLKNDVFHGTVKVYDENGNYRLSLEYVNGEVSMRR